jgi:putative membrane protein
MQPALTLVFLTFMNVPISAHVPTLVTPDTLWNTWSLEPLVLFSLASTSWLYGCGTHRVWARAGRGRGVSFANVVSFCAGQTIVIVALVSPLDSLGGTLLSAHMAQHGLLAGIAPPLLLMGRPGVAFAWGLSRFGITPACWRSLNRLQRAFSATAVATILHGVAIWLWHAPALFGAAVADHWVHALQHASFFVPSLLFWHVLLYRPSLQHAAAAAAAAFATFMHTGLLGGLVTMAPAPLYSVYVGRTEAWGVSALADQQLAGLLMWIPLGLPYLAVGLFLGCRLLGSAFDERVERTSNVPAHSPMRQESPTQVGVDAS